MFAHVAEAGGEVAALAVWFVSFSTWTGRHGIYLEDLIVTEAHRGEGLGRALVTELARIALARGYARLDWGVLHWNEPAHAFYRRLGGGSMDDWAPWRMGIDQIRALAER